MSKFFSFFILISSSLILFASIALYLSYQLSSQRNLPQTTRSVYKDADGKPLFVKGDCKIDSDCVPAGCSSQICSNDPELITTCEYSDSFPSEDTYSCGCIEKKCAWYK